MQFDVHDNGLHLAVYYIHTTLAWEFKGATQGLTHIFTGKYLDITWVISWEHGLLMALIPNQLKDTKCFDSFIEGHRAFHCGIQFTQ